MSTCCNENGIEVKPPTLVTKLIGETLYITYNGKTTPIDLSDLSGGGGSDIIKIPVDIISDGQTYFDTIIPEDSIVLEILIEGLVYEEEDENGDGDYIIVGRNITWSGDFALETTDKMILKTIQQNGNN